MTKSDLAEKSRQLISEFEKLTGREFPESFKLRYANIESEEEITELLYVIQQLKNSNVENVRTSERGRARNPKRNSFSIDEFISEEQIGTIDAFSIPKFFTQEQIDIKIVFEIWVSGDVDEASELELRSQILDLMSRSNLSLFSEEEPIRGSYYKKFLFLGKIINSYKLIANLKSHFGALATRSKIDVYNELYKMLDKYDSVALRCDSFLAIKITKKGKSHICITEVTPELAGRLENEPLLIGKPEVLLSYIKKPENVVALGAKKMKKKRITEDNKQIVDNASNE